MKTQAVFSEVSPKSHRAATVYWVSCQKAREWIMPGAPGEWVWKPNANPDKHLTEDKRESHKRMEEACFYVSLLKNTRLRGQMLQDRQTEQLGLEEP